MTMFPQKEIGIPGCYELTAPCFKDDRGCFVKTFHDDAFAAMGLTTHFAEEFYSLSHRNVLRGLHFQLPPKDHAKLVYCSVGSVLDVLLDVRVGSPTYGEHRTVELSADKPTMLYLCRGIAHGFMVMSDIAIMHYNVTTIHSPVHDAGILWSSAGIQWPSFSPLVSARDAAFPALNDFNSPFVFDMRADHDN